MEFKKLAAILVLAVFTQSACYNTYFISKTELKKLESSAEPQAIVHVYGDCPVASEIAITPSSLGLNGSLWAQVEPAAAETPTTPATEAADSALPPEIEEATKIVPDSETKPAPAEQNVIANDGITPEGCTEVSVSGGNALHIVTIDGNQRVTPFNFIMNRKQLVSPEYNLLLTMDDVKGAEVSEFSTWKTVGTIVGVSLVAVGTFVGISLLAPEAKGFTN